MNENSYGNLAADRVSFLMGLIYEIGHTIDLSQSDVENAIMFPSY